MTDAHAPDAEIQGSEPLPCDVDGLPFWPIGGEMTEAEAQRAITRQFSRVFPR